MKNYFFIIFTCIALMLFASCQDQSLNTIPAQFTIKDSSLSVADAKQIYIDFLKQRNSLRSVDSDKKNKFKKELQWQYAQKEKFANGEEVILVPLDPKVNNYTHGVLSLKNQKDSASIDT